MRHDHRLLIVVDMQNDFISGSLGSEAAEGIVQRVCEKIKNWEGDVVYTRDTHYIDYLASLEGRHIPVKHCVTQTDGWQLDPRIEAVRDINSIEYLKATFGSQQLARAVRDSDYESVCIVGLCTDICVITNALLIRTLCPELDIEVDAACCAGTSARNHEAALTVMKQCCIDVKGQVFNNAESVPTDDENTGADKDTTQPNDGQEAMI